MYLFPVETKASTINGTGVFALQKINKGEIVWKFDKNYDKVLSIDEYNTISRELKEELYHIAYLSPTTNRYVYPPTDDPAKFTNHSRNNNLTAIIDKNISEEPYFIANRDIEVGEEITNNYEEFDVVLKSHRPDYI